MCTLALSLRPSPDVVFRIAANRDEALSRAAEPPFIWEDAAPERRFLAPRDSVGGGTWLGLTASGLFVGITNRFGAPKDPTRRSRGQLVVEALTLNRAEAVARWLEQLPVEDFSPFHLVYADAANAFATAWTGDARVHQRLAPGLHVFTERSFGAGDDTARVQEVCAGWPAREAFDGLPLLLARHHSSAPFDSLCVHAPAFQYGTRSSWILELAEDAAASRLAFTDGPPCTTPFVSGDALLRALSR